MLGDRAKKRVIFFCKNLDKIKNTVHHLESEGMLVETWLREPTQYIFKLDKMSTMLLISIDYEKVYGVDFKKQLKTDYPYLKMINFDENTSLSTILSDKSSRQKSEAVQAHLYNEAADSIEYEISDKSTPQELLDLLTLTIQPRKLDLPQQEPLDLFYYKKSDDKQDCFYLFGFPKINTTADKGLRTVRSLIDLNSNDENLIGHFEHQILKNNYDIAFKNAQFRLDGSANGQEVCFSYVTTPHHKDDNFQMCIKNEMCNVRIEAWWCHMPLPVNMFIYLELNNKRILYLKKGENFSGDDMAKLKEKSLDSLWIETKDMHKYFQVQSVMSL